MGLFLLSSRGYPAYQVGAHTQLRSASLYLRGAGWKVPLPQPDGGARTSQSGAPELGRGGQWLRPGTRRTARKGRRNTGRKGAGCARGPPHRARALPCAHARSLRQALVAAAHSSGPAGGGASGSGWLAAARAPSCCSPGTGTEARLVPAPFTLSSSRLAQPVRVRGGPRQLEGGARGGVARRKKRFAGRGLGGGRGPRGGSSVPQEVPGQGAGSPAEAQGCAWS